MQSTSLTSVSPSFTAHSSNNLADIAARVVQEFRNQNTHLHDDIYSFDDDLNHLYIDNEPDYNPTQNDEDEEFEFAISADDIFFNGEILPRYPLFDRSLLLDDVTVTAKSNDSKRTRQPLGKLFIEERETASCSSSESDDLDGVSPETYCIWKPKDESCNKSNSTGNSSKRWKLRNLLRRSNSDIHMTARKNAPVIVFRQINTRSEKVKKVEKTAKVKPAPVTDEVKSANKFEANRVGSYLPYKQDLVGVFANVNGLSRNLRPF
ncbi:hypothetical protein QVD17_01544 [Tagetes erecta]|uniref:Uncharacterized protein n=1 Tax=Tagetes erecta TaxID=13708 RepID=A0AAD8LDP8_TARER|nr:hypothetical protein QVD17_01544 [Tagetes erecta]